MSVRFANRSEAGKALAKKLRHFAYHTDALVLALPRGGVPVGYEIASALHIPLQVFVVRKLGVPGHEEYAMGAIASGGSYFINETVVRQLRISEEEINTVIGRESREVIRREQEYGAGSHWELAGQTVILVDDGLATGSTMRAAVRAVGEQRPHSIVVAVPVAPRDTFHDFENEVDQVIALETPEVFYAVGEWYDDFSQTTDEEVRTLLKQATRNFHGAHTKPVVI